MNPGELSTLHEGRLNKLHKECLDDLLQTSNRRRKVSLDLQIIFNVNVDIFLKKKRMAAKKGKINEMF